jgi:hypothetical protein
LAKVPSTLSFDGRLQFTALSQERLNQFPYKYLIPICDSLYRRQYATTGKNFTDIEDVFWQRYKNTGADVSLIEDLANCYRVRPLWKNVMAQIEKCDAPKIQPSNAIWDRVMLLCKSYFSFLEFEPSHNTSDHTYDLTTSPGLPWTKMGYKTKREVLDKFPELFLKFLYDLDYPVIDCYNDKDELLEVSDLDRNKIRGIFGSAFQGITREKFLYGLQNNALLEQHARLWIKYGMVKQYGGFSKEMKTLEKFDCIVESDISGWDRKACLDPVYVIRNANLLNSEKYADLIETVTDSNTRPMVLLPSGYVVKRQTGNNSGKNNTTTDNSILHFLIVVYMLMKALDRKGHELTLSNIFENAEFKIYGDDKIGGINLYYFYDSLEEFKAEEVATYAEFGLEIKKTAQLITTKKPGDIISSEHSFLGSYAVHDSQTGMYIPHPRLGKVCSTFIQKYNNVDNIVRFCRVVNLVLNCYPNRKVFEQSLGYLKWFYKDCKNDRWRFDEILRDVDLDLNLDDSFRRIYLGFESRGTLKSIF